MPTGSGRRASSDGGATFSVESFGWGAPDRLVLTGAFSGLPADPPAPAVLTVIGEGGAHRLLAVDGNDVPAPVDSAPWTVAFAWLEAPVAFDRARLELGDRLAVDLPMPGATAPDGPLPVEPLQADDQAAQAPADEPHETVDVEGAVDRLRLEAQLLEKAEQVEEVRASARQAAAALQRVEADLAEERERRAADAERFREGLATVRSSAEEAIRAAAVAHQQAEEQARSEIAALREQVAALESAGSELDGMRSELDGARTDLEETRGELEETRDELDRVRAELEAARGALDAARAGARALLDRLADPTIAGR